jgi:plasmid segregation protein ParM
MSENIAIDNGRAFNKIATQSKTFSYPSVLGEWKDRSGFKETKFGEYDLEIEFESKRWFGGTLALNESTFQCTMHTETKDRLENLVNILTSIHLATEESNIRVITCQPIKVHTDENKRIIKEMLLGSKTITVNGITKTFNIEDVLIACEGGVAAYSLSSYPKLLRLIDVGSATINTATLRNDKFILNESSTLPFGLDTEEDIDLEKLASKVISECSKKWKPTNHVVLVGGGAEKLLPYIQDYFKKTTLHPHHQFANVMGMYKVGCSQWQVSNVS